MKEKKYDKKRLRTLVLLLFLTIVMLSTATYAWFTSNKQVKINAMNVHVSASEGFQISVDGINWKSVISTADILGADTTYSGNKNHVPTSMVPVSTAAVESDEDGFLDFFFGQVTTDSSGEYVLIAEKINEVAKATGQFIGFDLFFRTNSAMHLQLDGEAGAAVRDIGTQNKGMENSARVAFVEIGNINDTNAGAASQSLKTTKDDGSNITIWEPNYKSHTEASKIEAFNMYGISTTSAIYTEWIQYSGIKAAITETNAIKIPLTTASASPTYFAELDQARFVLTEKDNTYIADTGIILLPGISKFKIYMWLEGQDYDCSDSASGSDIIFDLIMSADKVLNP